MGALRPLLARQLPSRLRQCRAKSARRAPTWDPSMLSGWGRRRSLARLLAAVGIGSVAGSLAGASAKGSSWVTVLWVVVAVGDPRCPQWWWRQGPMITGWLVMMVMGMRGRPWRPDICRPRRDTARPRTTRRISLPPGAGPTRWRRPGPLTLSTSIVVSRRMVSWGVLASVGPVRSSLASPTSWSVVFWPVGAGPSHQTRWKPRTSWVHGTWNLWLSWLSWTWTTRRSYAWQEVEGPLPEHVSQLSRPSSLALGTSLPLSLPYVYASVRWLSLEPARPPAANPYRSHRANLQYTKWGPRLNDTAGSDSGCHYASIVSAARQLELRLGGRRPVTWLGFRHLVNTGTAGHGDETNSTSWPKATSQNIHTWERLTSDTAATNYLRFDARICLGRPLGQCVFRLTSADERGENRSERQVDTVLCAGAAACGAERGLNFIVWNFAWDRMASRLHAATATTFLMRSKIKKDGITQTSLVVAINRLKDPPTWLKVATTLEKPPTPTHWPLGEVAVILDVWFLNTN